MTEHAEEALEYPEEVVLQRMNLADQIKHINTFIDLNYIVQTDKMDRDLLLHARRTIPMRYIGKDLLNITVRTDLTEDLAAIDVHSR